MLTNELRKSILQSAVTGRLVEQHQSDGNVDELLSYIASERESLIQEKVIKKPNVLALVSGDEIPFDIPKNWRWVRLGDLWLDISTGLDIPGKNQSVDKNIPYFKMNNIDNFLGIPLWSNLTAVDVDDEIVKKYKLEEGDFLFNTRNSRELVGKSCIISELPHKNIIFNNNIARIKFSNNLDRKYILNVLISPFGKEQLGKVVKATTNVAAIYQKDLINILFPLPPLEEQKRIVEKIEEVMKKVDEYEKFEKELFVLKQAFPGDLKKSLLQAAIQGKLVEQHDSDGNVDELIEAINTERERLINEKIIKKPKALNPITEEDIPFDIPDSWKWIRHNEIFQVIGGSQPPKAKFIFESTEGYIRLYQTRDYGNNPQPVYIPISDAKKVSKEGDILLARYGGSLGKVFWAEDGAYNVALAKVVPLYKSDLVSKKYIYYYYLSPIYQSFVQKMSRSAQAGFNKGDLNELLFPLPPFEEQKRIVEKLEQLLPLCDELM